MRLLSRKNEQNDRVLLLYRGGPWDHLVLSRLPADAEAPNLTPVLRAICGPDFEKSRDRLGLRYSYWNFYETRSSYFCRIRTFGLWRCQSWKQGKMRTYL